MRLLLPVSIEPRTVLLASPVALSDAKRSKPVSDAQIHRFSHHHSVYVRSYPYRRSGAPGNRSTHSLAAGS